jgi:hypothetical protein
MASEITMTLSSHPEEKPAFLSLMNGNDGKLDGSAGKLVLFSSFIH